MDTIATLLAVLAQARNDTIAFRSHLQTNISVVKHTISVLLLQRRHQVRLTRRTQFKTLTTS